jgi:hypothetical protein
MQVIGCKFKVKLPGHILKVRLRDDSDLREPQDAVLILHDTPFWLVQGRNLCKHGTEDRSPVLSADERIAGPFRVRHHAEDVPGFVHDAGDVVY